MQQPQHKPCAGRAAPGDGAHALRPSGPHTRNLALLNALGGRAEAMAAKYVWWQEPRRTLSSPTVLVAQVMNLGTLEDVQWLLRNVCEDALRRTLREAPAGTFNNRSWCFWHLRLGIRPTPPLPTRPTPR